MKPIKKKNVYDPFDSLLAVRRFIEDYPLVDGDDVTKFKKMLKGMLFHKDFLFHSLYGEYIPFEAIQKYNMILRDLSLLNLYSAYSLADSDDKRFYVKWCVNKLYDDYYKNNYFKLIQNEFY